MFRVCFPAFAAAMPEQNFYLQRFGHANTEVAPPLDYFDLVRKSKYDRSTALPVSLRIG